MHLPIQSGSNKILKSMNRKHNVEKYIDIIDKIRSAKKGIAISSDFIVGFPGETDKDFEDTLDLVKNIEFAQAFSFNYSPRPGTPSADYEVQIPQAIKSERLNQLQGLLKEQQFQFNNQFIGKTVKILIEKVGKEGCQLVGRTPHLQSVFFEDIRKVYKIGEFADIKINSVKVNNLSGELIENS